VAQLLSYRNDIVAGKMLQNRNFLLTQHFIFVISRAMVRNHSGTWRSSAHSRSLSNYQWVVAFATLTLLLVTRQPSKAQTAEAGQVTVTGDFT
jgi:hypothetical protein